MHMGNNKKPPLVVIGKGRVVSTTKLIDIELTCQKCGAYPLRLTGKKTLVGYTNRKAVCDFCDFEEDF